MTSNRTFNPRDVAASLRQAAEAIEEAAAILRISRNAAYAAARKWRATGGKVGIPCIEIGRTVRVPRADLDKLLGRTNGSDAA